MHSTVTVLNAIELVIFKWFVPRCLKIFLIFQMLQKSIYNNLIGTQVIMLNFVKS